MKKTYTLEEAFALVGTKAAAVAAEVQKNHSYLNNRDRGAILDALEVAPVDPARAARLLDWEDTIVREAAVEAIVKISGGAR